MHAQAISSAGQSLNVIVSEVKGAEEVLIPAKGLDSNELLYIAADNATSSIKVEDGMLIHERDGIKSVLTDGKITVNDVRFSNLSSEDERDRLSIEFVVSGISLAGGYGHEIALRTLAGVRK